MLDEIFLEETESTNEFAKKNLESFNLEKITVIYTNNQTKGKGRFEREWISPKNKNISASYVFTLPSNHPNLTSISNVLAISFAKVLMEKKLNPQIKWPNDILLNEKKLSGILSSISIKGKKAFVIAGIGINVNAEKEDLKNIDQKTTSLLLETKKNWDIKTLLQNLNKTFLQDLSVFKEKGFLPFYDLFQKLLFLKSPLVITHKNKKYKGTFLSLSESGELNLKTENGIKTFSSGEIED